MKTRKSLHTDVPVIHASAPEIRIECGGQPITIDKLFGPLVACAVRVHLDSNKGEWVVERETCQPGKGEDGSDLCGWEEMARFDCQESLNLSDDEDGEG